MELRFIITEEDWRHLARITSNSGWGMFQFYMSFVPLFLLGLFLSNAGLPLYGWTCMTLSIVVGVAGYEVPRLLHLRRYRLLPRANEERALTFNKDGIVAIYPSSKCEYQWRAFSHYRETDFMFVIFNVWWMSLWVPKRGMSQEQILQLRKILADRLPVK